MKRVLKSILSLSLVLMLFVSIAVPAFAAGQITPTVGTINSTRGCVDDNVQNRFGLTLAVGNKNFTIKRSDITVTKGTADAKLVGFRKNYNGMREELDREGNGTWVVAGDNKNYNYHITLQTQSTGSFKIKYKIGAKSYSIKVNVLPYENCVGTIKLTGVNGGKSFASLTKKQGSPLTDLVLASTTKNAKLTVKPKGDWLITGMTVVDDTAGTEQNFRVLNGNSNGLTSATMNCGTLRAGHRYRVTVTFWKDTGSMYGSTQGITYQIS